MPGRQDVTLSGVPAVRISVPRVQLGRWTLRAPAPAIVNTGPVWGSAVGNYDTPPLPGGPWTQQGMFDWHEANIGTVGCYRTYSDPGPMPANWNATPNVLNGAETLRWQWHSYKPDLTTLAAGGYYTTIKNYCLTIPQNGMIKILTPHHEADASGKITATNTAAKYKQGFYEFCRAVKDSGHPDLRTALIFTTKFSLDVVDSIIATTNVSTATLRSVVDILAWDPYNGATFTGDYSSGKQGPAGVSFYVDPLLSWNAANFPAARLGIGEMGYRPNQLDLSMRPAYIQAFADRMASEGAFAVCYFDNAVKPERENWIGWYSNPRSAATFSADTASRTKLAAVYAAYPPYAV